MSEPSKLLNYSIEVENFLDTLFEGQDGFIYTPTKNPATGYWQKYFFSWPEQRDDAVTHILDATRDKEVYLAPSLFNRASAKRENWKGTNFVWVEFDGNAPQALPKGIPQPTLKIQSSTKGHEHWYWRLKEFESSPELVQGLSKQLTYTLNADKSGWDANQVLRPPGTLHHDSKRRVRLLVAGQSVVSFADFTGLVEAPPEVIVNTNITSLPDLQDVIAAYKWPTDARDLFKKKMQPHGSRSSAMTRMAFHCVEMGMTNEEAYVILLNCDDRWGKYKNRTPESRAKVLTGIIAHARNSKAIQAEIRLSDYEPMYTIDELLNLDYSKIDWIFEEVLAETSLGIIAADPDTGKSTLAMQMGMAIILGKDFLTWKVKKGGINVGFFSYEMDTRQCAHFISTMLHGYNNIEQEVLRTRFRVRPTGYAVPLNRPEEQQKILDYVDKYDLKFLIFDSLKSITDVDERKSTEFFNFVNKYLRVERNCTVVVIHHNRKPPQEGRTGEQSLADLYGDVFISANAVTVIGMRKKANQRIEIANTKSRLAPAFKTFRVKRGPFMQFEVDTLSVAAGKPETEKKNDDNVNKFDL